MDMKEKEKWAQQVLALGLCRHRLLLQEVEVIAQLAGLLWTWDSRTSVKYRHLMLPLNSQGCSEVQMKLWAEGAL